MECENSLRKLKPTPEPVPTSIAYVDKSSSVEEVRYAQDLLRQVGLLDAADVDGIWDKDTETALQRFKTWFNDNYGSQYGMISEDAVFDGYTIERLEQVIDVGLRVQFTNPTPGPAPTPTAAPTAVPKDLLSTAKTRGFTIPESSGQLVSGISAMEVSAANNYGVLHITGFSYINDAKYKGTDFETWVVAKRENTGKLYAYQTKVAPGMSGDAHDGAVVTDVQNADFEVFFDVKRMETAIYHVSIVTGYKNEKNKMVYDYNDLGDEIWFTVMNGEVIKIPKDY